MNSSGDFNERNLINMMYGDESLSTFKDLWKKDACFETWSNLLHACYWELSYQRVGGDDGHLENPPINMARIKRLEELIDFLESSGIRAINDAP